GAGRPRPRRLARPGHHRGGILPRPPRRVRSDPQHHQRRHPRGPLPAPARPARRDGRRRPAAREAAPRLRRADRRRQGARRLQHRRNRRDPGDARLLRRARPRGEDRDDRGRRGRRRLRPGGRRGRALPRRHRHRHLRGRRGGLSSRARRARRFRPATQADAERDGHRFEWLKPDGWRTGFRALVLELADPDGGARVIGVGRIGPNPVHPGRDLAELEIAPEHRRRGHGTALLHELRKYSDKPLSSKAAPGSERELFLRTLGAVTYLEVPLLRLDVAAQRTAGWAATVRAGHDGGARAVPWSDLPREQVIDALTDRYLWQHASWSPTASRDVVRPVVGEEFYEDSAHEHSIAVVRDGQITAL